jgi:dTDP-4-amino-4,6-dideoxygalactose transaminase
MIKFLDLKLVNQPYNDLFREAFDKFLNTGQYILGEQLLAFEKEFAHYCGTKFCIGVSNGLDALKLIFEGYKELGVLRDGDEVLVPANTYIASVLAISNSGLKPVFVEPNMETYNIDVSSLEKSITLNTKAILGVHLFGNLYDVIQLENISKKHNLLLIEDAAQAHGAVFNDGRKAGNLSHIAAFSFYPTKNLGALGDAGTVTTNNEKLYQIILKLRNYGRVSTYENDLKGFNNRMDELQAVFLRIKLKHLDRDNNKIRDFANYYLDHINSEIIQLPKIIDIRQHVFHQFVVTCKERDRLKEYLLNNGVETMIHYPIPVPKQLAYIEFSDLTLPISETLSQDILSLPLNTSLSINQLKYIVSVLNSFS